MSSFSFRSSFGKKSNSTSYKTDVDLVPPRVTSLKARPGSYRSSKHKSAELFASATDSNSSDVKMEAFPPASSEKNLHVRNNDDSFNSNFNKSSRAKSTLSFSSLTRSMLQKASKNTKNYQQFEKMGLPLPEYSLEDFKVNSRKKPIQIKRAKRGKGRKYLLALIIALLIILGAGAGYLVLFGLGEEEDDLDLDICSHLDLDPEESDYDSVYGVCVTATEYITCSSNFTVMQELTDCPAQTACHCTRNHAILQEAPCGIPAQECSYP